MEPRRENEAPAKNPTTTERPSDRELVVTRTVYGPARLVWQAWTQSELFQRWWCPKSFPLKLVACDLDVRVGGKYRLVYDYQGSTMEFFGRYLEVTPHSRLAWTNEEQDQGEQITTVTFEDDGGQTRVVLHDLYPSKEALEAAIDSGSTSCMPETLEQLDELLRTLG